MNKFAAIAILISAAAQLSAQSTDGIRAPELSGVDVKAITAVSVPEVRSVPVPEEKTIPTEADVTKDEDTYLGRTTISHGTDFDRIRVRECGINSVLLKVRNAAVNIDYLSVRFGNGNTQELQVREIFKPGSESRRIDLKGNKRCVVEIQVIGRAIGFGIPVLEFFGFSDL